MIYDALLYAREIHDKQKRQDNGHPYLTHLTRVAGAVMCHPECDEEMIVAALLHDSLEDHPDKVSLEGLTERFGGGVAALVDELTNASKDSKAPRAQRKAQDRARLAGVSKRAKIIKLYDRIDNLSEMSSDFNSVSEKRREFYRLYAKESELLCDAIGDTDRNLNAQLRYLTLRLKGA